MPPQLERQAPTTVCVSTAAAAVTWRSLRAHLAGVHPPLLSVPVHPLEILEAWGAAEPDLPKVHVAGEEKLAVPGPDAALQQRGDAPPPASTLALRGWPEHPALLPVEPAHVQVDGRLLPLRLVDNFLDGASDDCRGRREGQQDAYQANGTPPTLQQTGS